MKPGDKVWFYDHDKQEITTARVISYESVFDDGDFVTVQFDDTDTRAVGLKDGVDVFPTRDALCEHYRKIFE